MKKTFEAKDLIMNGRFVHLYEDAPEDKKAYLLKRVGELSEELKKYRSKKSSLYLYYCNITTSIACLEYDISRGISRADSIEEMSGYQREFMASSREKYINMFQKKWMWPILRLMIPKLMCKINGEGFHCYVPKNKDKTTIIFIEDKCMFNTVLKEKGMLDLGQMFCKIDEYMYGNIPGTKFVRIGTLCNGDPCCDFKFVKE